MEVLVLFDYDSQADDELTIRKGDIILNVQKQEGGWWEGTLGTKRGVFPDNFVKVVCEAEMNSSVSSAIVRTEKGRNCKVLFSYSPTHEDELSLVVGDEVQFLEQVEDGWWRGVLHGKTGVFPSNFVTMIENTGSHTAKLNDNNNVGLAKANNNSVSAKPALLVPDSAPPELPPKPIREYARVVFPYSADQPDELDLKEGDIVTVLSRDCEDKGWWKGELNNKIGVFPDNFVELLPQNANNVGTMKPERPPTSGSSATAATRSSLTTSTSESDGHLSTNGSTSTVSSRVTLSPKDQMVNIAAFVEGIAAEQKNCPPTAGLSVCLSSLSDEQKLIEKMQNVEEVDYNHVIKPTEALAHPTASRVKPAKRRPPSSIFLKEIDSNAGGLISPTANGANGLSAHNEEPDIKPVDVKAEEQPDMKVRSKANVTKPPWMEELKRNQEEAKKNQERRLSTITDKPAPPPAPAKPIMPKTAPSGKPTVASSTGRVNVPSTPVDSSYRPTITSPQTNLPVGAGKLPVTSPVGVIKGPVIPAESPVLQQAKQPSSLAPSSTADENISTIAAAKVTKQPPPLVPNSVPIGKPTAITSPPSVPSNNFSIQEELVDLRNRVQGLEMTVLNLQTQLSQMKLLVEEDRKLRLQEASPFVHL